MRVTWFVYTLVRFGRIKRGWVGVECRVCPADATLKVSLGPKIFDDILEIFLNYSTVKNYFQCVEA